MARRPTRVKAWPPATADPAETIIYRKGTIPGSTYPVTVESGDTLMVAGWYRNSDLEYYVYSEGQDILDLDTYYWKGSDSGTMGMHNVAITSGGKYYVRYNRLA